MIEKIKQFLGLEKVRETSVAGATEKWRRIALDLNSELQVERRVNKALTEEVARLKNIAACQGELLAERGE